MHAALSRRVVAREEQAANRAVERVEVGATIGQGVAPALPVAPQRRVQIFVQQRAHQRRDLLRQLRQIIVPVAGAPLRGHLRDHDMLIAAGAFGLEMLVGQPRDRMLAVGVDQRVEGTRT